MALVWNKVKDKEFEVMKWFKIPLSLATLSLNLPGGKHLKMPLLLLPLLGAG
jgi:hypothetical protein